MIEVELPDGSIAEFPDGTPNETIEGVLQQQFGGSTGQSAPYDPMKTLANAPESAYNFGKAMVQPFIHPIDTFNSLSNLAGGAMNKLGADELNSFLADKGLAVRRNPADVQREEAMADAVGGFYKNRYGSWDGFKRGLEQDPFGIAGDAATVLTGGGAAVSKIGPLAKVGSAMSVAGAELNPITQAGRVGKVAGKTAKNVLGMTTGTSADAISEAYRAGIQGGKQGQGFRDNMRGIEDPELVIDEAMTGMRNIKDAQGRQYKADMKVIKADQEPIDFRPIARKFNSLQKEAYHEGMQKASDQTIAKLADIKKVLREWQDKESLHNAAGLDALKQRIGEMMPSALDAGHAGRVVTEIYNEIRSQIIQQVPEYGAAMANYEKSAATLTELEKSLSLGKRASADTTLRKLQSVMRNNANTNYGSRGKSAQKLEDAGAVTMKAKLSGQSLNTWMPRGLRGPISAGILTGGLFPGVGWAAAPALLAGSPRLVGEATHLAGRAGKLANRLPVSKGGLLGLRALGGAGLLGSQSQEDRRAR
jgi:hypothetical protein